MHEAMEGTAARPTARRKNKFAPRPLAEAEAPGRETVADGGDFFKRSEYRHLRRAAAGLDCARLTDKQMVAVSLVFFGNVNKMRAARIMRITHQALRDHLLLGLKKIESWLAESR